MKVGLMLPTFTADPEPALAAAKAADAGGLDGVFVFDHLWPIGAPGRPALWSFGVLGAVAALTARVALGTLVARIELVPEDQLVESFATLAAMVGADRVIAGLGTGDHLSRPENDAYGIGQGPAGERLARVGHVADRLRASGLTTWVGGRSPATAAVALEHADALNVWAATSDELDQYRHRLNLNWHNLTWGGPVLIGRDDVEAADLRARFDDRPGLVHGTVTQVAAGLRGFSLEWVVCAPLDYLVHPARAAETVCLVAEAVK